MIEGLNMPMDFDDLPGTNRVLKQLFDAGGTAGTVNHKMVVRTNGFLGAAIGACIKSPRSPACMLKKCDLTRYGEIGVVISNMSVAQELKCTLTAQITCENENHAGYFTLFWIDPMCPTSTTGSKSASVEIPPATKEGFFGRRANTAKLHLRVGPTQKCPFDRKLSFGVKLDFECAIDLPEVEKPQLTLSGLVKWTRR